MSSKKDNTKPHVLDRLFEDFFTCAQGTFESLEVFYDVKGLCAQVFGTHEGDGRRDKEKEQLRKSSAWALLVELYEYAVNGIEGANCDTQALVINGSDIIKMASSENYFPDQEWNDIIAMGDSRYALDNGMPLMLRQLALLANVDIRTVRNAASSGELVTHKSGPGEEPFADNASARRWLHGRRGFKPTVQAEDAKGLQMDEVSMPRDFGRFLAEQRAQLSDVEATRPVEHPSVTSATLTQLESGICTLPLDAVFPVADYYRLDRKPFLQCVMRVFFGEELRALTETASPND